MNKQTKDINGDVNNIQWLNISSTEGIYTPDVEWCRNGVGFFVLIWSDADDLSDKNIMSKTKKKNVISIC